MGVVPLLLQWNSCLSPPAVGQGQTGRLFTHPVLLKKFLISQSVYPARETTDEARLGSYEIGV
jgi:hypothetical protein